MEDTMTPSKPEDYKPAIQTDKKILKKEFEFLLSPDFKPTKPKEYIEDYNFGSITWSKGEPSSGPHIGPPANDVPIGTAKCTCPIKIESKKRKRSGKITISRNNNGYSSGFCPVHNNSSSSSSSSSRGS